MIIDYYSWKSIDPIDEHLVNLMINMIASPPFNPESGIPLTKVDVKKIEDMTLDDILFIFFSLNGIDNVYEKKIEELPEYIQNLYNSESRFQKYVKHTLDVEPISKLLFIIHEDSRLEIMYVTEYYDKLNDYLSNLNNFILTHEPKGTNNYDKQAKNS